MSGYFITVYFFIMIYLHMSHFLIFTVSIMVFLYEHQNIINIDFDLPDQLNLKDHVICNICTFLSFALPLVTQILIASEIIL